jgi:type III restriction enzyme
MGYVIATPNSKAFDDPGIFVEIDIVQRPRVISWKTGYTGVTGITKRLLDHLARS